MTARLHRTASHVASTCPQPDDFVDADAYEDALLAYGRSRPLTRDADTAWVYGLSEAVAARLPEERCPLSDPGTDPRWLAVGSRALRGDYRAQVAELLAVDPLAAERAQAAESSSEPGATDRVARLFTSPLSSSATPRGPDHYAAPLPA